MAGKIIKHWRGCIDCLTQTGFWCSLRNTDDGEVQNVAFVYYSDVHKFEKPYIDVGATFDMIYREKSFLCWKKVVQIFVFDKDELADDNEFLVAEMLMNLHQIR